MNEDEIIRMAAEAKLWLHSDRDYEKVEKFAHLVAAAEREAIADMVSDCSIRATPKGIAAAIRTRVKDAC